MKLDKLPAIYEIQLGKNLAEEVLIVKELKGDLIEVLKFKGKSGLFTKKISLLSPGLNFKLVKSNEELLEDLVTISEVFGTTRVEVTIPNQSKLIKEFNSEFHLIKIRHSEDVLKLLASYPHQKSIKAFQKFMNQLNFK